jgi:hypothetical protein
MAAKLTDAAAAFVSHCDQLCAAVRVRKAAMLGVSTPPVPVAPLARRAKPPLAAALAAVRSAAGAVRGGAELSGLADALLADPVRRGAVLAAVLPGADARRGDGALLAVLSVATTERAARYLRALTPHAPSAAARAATIAAALAVAVRSAAETSS